MNRVSSILGAAAVIAIAVVFIVQFRPAPNATGSSAPTCALEIRGDCISSTHYWAAYRLIAPRNAEAAQLKGMSLRKQAAEGLVDRWLLNEDAKRLGIGVSDSDVTAELGSGRVHVSLPADKIMTLGPYLRLDDTLVRILNVKDRKTKQFDNKIYEKEIRFTTKMSPPDFREFQRQEMVAARMRDLIRARTRVGENEAFEHFSYQKATATLSFVKLPRRYYADLVVDTSDKAASAWAETNKAEVDGVWENRKKQFLPECRVTRLIEVAIDPSAPDPDTAKADAKKKIEGVLQRIKEKDADFAERARRMSDDESATRGGLLGCVQKGKSKPVDEALQKLDAGEMSDVLETEGAFSLIKVEKIAKDAEAEELGKKQTIAEMYLAYEAERFAVEGAKKILAAVRGGKPMEDAVKAHTGEVMKGQPPKEGTPKKADAKIKHEDEAEASFGRPPLTAETHPDRPTVELTLPFDINRSPIPGIKNGINVATMAFELEKPGDVPGDVLPLEDQMGYAVIQLKEKNPPTKEQWDKDREFYVSKMREFKQNDALIAYMQRLRAPVSGEIKYSPIVNEPKEGSSDEPPVDLEE